MADLSQIPTDQLVQMLQGHPDVQAAQPQQTSQALGFYQGAMKPFDNAARGAKWVANAVIPGSGDAVDKLATIAGLPSTDQAIKGHSDYVASQQAEGIRPGMFGSAVGGILGTLPTAMIPGGILAQGAAAGALSTDAMDPVGIAKSAALGAATGKATEYGLGMLGKMIPKKVSQAALSSVPSTSQLFDASSAGYQAADKSGMIISGSSLKNMAANVQNTLAQEGFDPALHPATAQALSRLQSAASNGQAQGNITLKGLDVIRKVASQASTAQDGHMARILKGQIDDFASNLGPSDVLGGAVDQGAVDALKGARQLYATGSKSEIVDGLFERAHNATAANYTQAGYDTALRQQFKNLANSRGFARFNDTEQAAIKNVIQGGPIGNAMRYLGKFAPKGPMSTAITYGIGGSLGGLPGAVALGTAGSAARAASTAATTKSAELASAIVRNGGAPLPMTSPYIAYLLSKAKTPARIAAPVLAVNAANNTP